MIRTLKVRELNEKEQEKHNGIGLALVTDTEGGELILNYLYPMRAYCFQIGGLNANGCTNSSAVIGFGNVVKAMVNSLTMERSRSSAYSSNLPVMSKTDGENSIIHELINGQAILALNKLTNRYNNDEVYQEELNFGTLILDSSIGECNRQWNSEVKDWTHTVWSKFIDDVVKDIMESI